MFKAIGRIIRTTSFLLMLCITLASATLTLGIWTFQLTTQVASMGIAATTAAAAHRKAIAAAVLRAKTKEKAKARLRRLAVAIPVAGAGAAVAFETADFYEWRETNPDGTLREYACEVATISAEVVDEVAQELPEQARVSPDWFLDKLPTCEKAISENDGYQSQL